MRVSAIQYRPPKGDPERARSELVDAVGEAGTAGARLIVCPEMATTGYIWPSAQALAPHAEPAGGPTAEALGQVARAHGAWVFCGYAEQDQGQLYNSMVILGPTGALVGSYRKVLLYASDQAWASPGTERMMVHTEHGTVLPGICMDLNDPLFIAHLHHLQPDVLAFPTNWVEEGTDPLAYWRMRLHPWQGGFIAANTWGQDGAISFTGRSAILGPGGNVLARAESTGNQVLVADLNLQR